MLWSPDPSIVTVKQTFHKNKSQMIILSITQHTWGRDRHTVLGLLNQQMMHTEWHKWLLVIGLSWQSEADPGEGPGGPAPRYSTLFLDQTEAWRAKKIFFGDWAPPYRRVWMTLTYISPYFSRGGVGLRKYKKLKDLFILKLEFYQP